MTYQVKALTTTAYFCMMRTGVCYPAKILNIEAKDERHALALAKVRNPELIFLAECVKKL